VAGLAAAAGSAQSHLGLKGLVVPEQELLVHPALAVPDPDGDDVDGERLYQIYPKLGVTSRAALRDALSGNEIETRQTDSANALRGDVGVPWHS
jgi:hypothetical protein